MIRLYGISLGQGSYARISAGIEEGLRAAGLFAGFVPVDAFDEDEPYPGHDAEVALVVGPAAEGLQTAKAAGWHKKHLVLLAPNSSWLPPKLMSYLVGQGALLGAPSAWGAGVLASYGIERPWVYQHGVDTAFVGKAEHAERLDGWYKMGRFRVLHLSSTTGERKGTRELVRAWHALLREGALPDEALLEVIYAGAPSQIYAIAEQVGGPKKMLVSPPVSFSPAEMAQLYRSSHVVCQPSRGEGFGMVPLEAAATGSVVVMTVATGHTEYAGDLRGVCRVAVGEEAPIDDGPGALAPALDEDDIRVSLRRSYIMHETLSQHARGRAPELAQKWSWEAVTKRWVKEMEARQWI